MHNSSPAQKVPRKSNSGKRNQQGAVLPGGRAMEALRTPASPLLATAAVQAARQRPPSGLNATPALVRGMFADSVLDIDILAPFEVDTKGHACQGQCDKGARCPFSVVPTGSDDEIPCKAFLQLGYCPREVKLFLGWDKQEGCNCSLHLCRSVDNAGTPAATTKWWAVAKENVKLPLPSLKMTEEAMLKEIKGKSKDAQHRRESQEEQKVHRVVYKSAVQAILHEGKLMDARGDAEDPMQRFQRLLQIRNVKEEEASALKKPKH